ncbi:hypothetical protein [Sulfurisoma sediminicola]|uniref:Uncharacterized protein n=1 Tax=Sulfurisoma sediminicola TaxID=1381557 RepID=A0A497XEZ7_9PROT|nr:hypothetical protein [Sulfurisoma sediminicola]RLJ64768.1 hypothetical protein DFR35_1414 [Sulfurisoma sediminicola]
MWQYDYYDALEVAAKAGDSESAFQLAKYHGTKWSAREVGDKLEIWGADHYQIERDYLSAAVGARHPGAQKQLAGHLLRGHPDFGYKPITGLKLWLAGYLGGRLARRNGNHPVEERLNSLAIHTQPTDSQISSGRKKLSYQGAAGKEAVCGIRYHFSDNDGAHIVLEELPGLSLPSAMNAAERVATKILYVLLLEGKSLKPEDIHWYNAFPAGSSLSIPDHGTLQRVWFDWNGVGYSSPRWEVVSPEEIPIDLSDIIGVSA